MSSDSETTNNEIPTCLILVDNKEKQKRNKK